MWKQHNLISSRFGLDPAKGVFAVRNYSYTGPL
jgi:hypothetical protein